MLTKSDIVTAILMPFINAAGVIGAYEAAYYFTHYLDSNSGIDFIMIFVFIPVALIISVIITVALLFLTQFLLGRRTPRHIIVMTCVFYLLFVVIACTLLIPILPAVWSYMVSHGYDNAANRHNIKVVAGMLYFLCTSISYLLARYFAGRDYRSSAVVK